MALNTGTCAYLMSQCSSSSSSRLTSDIYPGDLGWAVNWDKPEERQEWYHNMSSVMQAGPCVRSNQLDYDEDVMYKVSF
jgi:choline-sulfatase